MLISCNFTLPNTEVTWFCVKKGNETKMVQCLRRNINHIILADDDDDDSMLFKEALSKVASSITVSLAEDGQKLINYLNTLSIPDMIFLDLNMPRKNGLECLKEIRSDDKFDHIPVIMYSTSQSKKDIEAC